MPQIDALEILTHFYPEDTPLRQLLLLHSRQVEKKALDLLHAAPAEIASRANPALVSQGALLHDLGIGQCHAPGILCQGKEPYLAHGILGAQMLREYGRAIGLDLEPFARICERHTGSGLTAAEIQAQNLPIPARDFLPETLEEKLVCLADKFFSKSETQQEKPLARIRQEMAKFGEAPLHRFEEMCRLFQLR